MSPRIINDRYFLLPKPRTGGMADVYKANDGEEDGRQVAVKVFKHGCIEAEILAESYRREIQALSELKHPSIVELFDSGQDKQTGEHFLVLEWMEQDLGALLRKEPLEGWDSYWEKLALPILKALAFSHERKCVHRDIKPSNILIGNNGRLKLADFGISKLRGYFRPTVTLREFVSRPFTPPEEEDGSYPYARDVFSFGVVTLKSLTDVELTDYDSIPRAIAAFDAPPEVVEIIERAVSNDPAERQANAEVLLAELDAVGQKRSRSQMTQKYTCYLQLTHNAIKKLQDELQLSEESIQKVLLEDLSAGCGIAKKIGGTNGQSSDNHYSIFGFSYRYLVAAEQDCLVVINAQSFSSAILEQNRERYWQPPYKFRFEKPLIKWEAEDVIRELKLSIEEHEANLKQSRAEDEKQRVFRIWWDILRAKTEWEQKREKAFKYRSFTQDSNYVIFQLTELPEEDIVGQSRHVTNAKGFSLLGGDVVKTSSDELHLAIKYGQIEHLPQSGELRFDTRLAEIALNRQKSALDAIRYDRAVRSNLRELLTNPREIKAPTSNIELQFIQNLNESQKEVVKAALSTQDLLLVQGPPGTGKTTFITEIILQTLQNDPKSRILLSSQTHVALDNALERIQAKHPNLKLIRIGDRRRVSQELYPLLLEEQMEQWRKEVVCQGQKFLTDWSARRGIAQQDLEKAILFQELKNLALNLNFLRVELESRKKEREENFPLIDEAKNHKPQRKPNKIKLNSLRAELEKGGNLLIAGNINNSKVEQKRIITLAREEEFQRLEEDIDKLEKQAKTLRDEQKGKAKRLQEITRIKIDELLKLTAEELEQQSKSLINPNAPDAKLLQRLISLQAEWFDQCGRSERFNAPLIERSQVVAGTCIGVPKEISDIEFDLCIVDEASKATATEVLVPMARSKKWLLVGDPKQLPPFQDEASRNVEFLEKYDLSLEDIQETLFERLLKTLPDECRKMLTIQHRMVEPIGRLISNCFYDNQLSSDGPEIDRILSEILQRPVTWLTTSRLPNSREQIDSSSFSNSCEVSVIIEWLKQLNQVAIEAQKQYKIAILSGYAAQLKLLKRSIDTKQSSLESLTIDCNTVDAFQGREANIVVYSVTRSNRSSKIGFLRDEARLNVALSRGRVGLVIVGDSQFCRTLSHSPLHQVLNYIEQHPEDCVCTEANL